MQNAINLNSNIQSPKQMLSSVILYSQCVGPSYLPEPLTFYLFLNITHTGTETC